ncbi:MAG: hypothetical protein PQ975_02940 [Methanobacterium sp.]
MNLLKKSGGGTIAEPKYKLSRLSTTKKAILVLLTAFVLIVCVMPASAENNTTNNTTNSTPYTISTFDGAVGADVTQNAEINKHINRTPLSNEILDKQKQGSTIIQFGNGSSSGNKLLIWSGIHGNEVEANIATMNYLEYLKEFSKSNVLDGTLYVIPFAIPKSTAVNSRNYGPIPYTYTEMVPYKKGWYRQAVTRWVRKVQRAKQVIRGRARWVRQVQWVKRVTHRRVYGWLYRPVTKTGYKYEDPNRIANVPGTPGWNAVEFAKNNGISHILDVHSGGGLEGYPNGMIFATPNRSGESNWADYISNQTKCAVDYGDGKPGMVRIHGHNYGINTITLEVERDNGCSAQWAGKTYKMIEAACKYLFSALR